MSLPREPSEKGQHRRVVVALQEQYRASERLVLGVVGQHRRTHRHPAKFVSIEKGKLEHRPANSQLNTSALVCVCPTTSSSQRAKQLTTDGGNEFWQEESQQRPSRGSASSAGQPTFRAASRCRTSPGLPQKFPGYRLSRRLDTKAISG